MINYDKIHNSKKNNNISSLCSNKTSGAFEGVHESTIINEEYRRKLLLYPLLDVALEADGDNPFGNLEDSIVDDTATNDQNDNAFDNADETSEGGNPFDSIDDSDSPFDDNEDNVFGDNDSDSSKPKIKTPILDREKSIKDKFNISKIIRKDFPSYIHSLQNIIKNSIDILEKKNVPSELQAPKDKIVFQYREVLTSVEDYIDVIDSEKYEDIFSMYVKFWSILNKLKVTAEKIMN